MCYLSTDTSAADSGTDSRVKSGAGCIVVVAAGTGVAVVTGISEASE